MRPRFVISILVLATMLLAVVFWLRPVQPATVPTPTQETQHTNLQAGNVNVVPHNISHTPLLVTASTSQKLPAINPRSPEGFRHRIESSNVPIDFYGLIIDQYSNPVPDVKVDIGIRHWTIPDTMVLQAGSKEISLDQISDADGRFEFHGATGDGFGLIMTKDGYLSPPNARYGFGPQAGTSENPIIFKMWKLGEKAQLVSGSKFWGITPDGQTYTIDLLQQSKVESGDAPGDIRISVTRPAQIKPRTHFDWSFSIEAINGGLIKTNDEFMYLAPESGYEPSYQITMSATNANWKRELDGLQFYLKSRDGQVYGSLKFDLIPDYNAVSIFNVSWLINPNGSRNLQP